MIDIWLARDKSVVDEEYDIPDEGGIFQLYFGNKPVRSGYWDSIAKIEDCEPYWQDGYRRTKKKVASKKYYCQVWDTISESDYACFAPIEIEQKFATLTWDDEPVKLAADDFPEILHIGDEEMTRDHFLRVWSRADIGK